MRVDLVVAVEIWSFVVDSFVSCVRHLLLLVYDTISSCGFVGTSQAIHDLLDI